MSLIRQFAVPAFLAVFGTVSLLGSGLHLLPGCGHAHGGSTCCGIHASECRRHSPQNSRELGKSASDCPICRFLATPRTAPPPPAIVVCGLYVDSHPSATTVRPAIERASTYGARAPPQSL
jgi:hypothetical protein